MEGRKRMGLYDKQNEKCAVDNLSSNYQNRNVLDVLPKTELLLDVRSLGNLTNFLDNNSNITFNDISVLPNFLKNVMTFLNQRKQLNNSYKTSVLKSNIVSDAIEKQYYVAMQKINNELYVQLECIDGNVKQQMLSIEKNCELEIKKIEELSAQKNLEMTLQYSELKNERKERERQFDKMIEILTWEEKNRTKILQEVEQVCEILRHKLCNDTASSEERRYYMDLMKFRISAISVTSNMVVEIASKIRK